MNRTLRSACLLVVSSTALAALSGCTVEASLSAESLTRFEGSPVSQTVAWVPGQGIRISGGNGDIKAVAGSSPAEASVTFSPFTMNEDDKSDVARDEMENDLTLQAITATDGALEFNAVRGGGASSYLGADIRVVLPAGFDGAFGVDQGNGDVDVDLSGGSPASTDVENTGAGDISVGGAAGALRIVGGFDVTVGVASWSASDGSVTTDGYGDIHFALPTAADGTMTAQTSGALVEPAPLPEGWVSAEAAPNSKSYTMGTGVGGNVDIRGDLGDITIVAQ